jgi:hypothetical protein
MAAGTNIPSRVMDDLDLPVEAFVVTVLSLEWQATGLWRPPGRLSAPWTEATRLGTSLPPQNGSRVGSTPRS